MHKLRDYILQVLACVAAAAYRFHLHFIELGAINWFSITGFIFPYCFYVLIGFIFPYCCVINQFSILSILI